MKILINCFFFFFFFSCKKEDASFDLLKQAKSIADIKPLEALVLLDSIQNPESMDKDNYMQYITAYVQFSPMIVSIIEVRYKVITLL